MTTAGEAPKRFGKVILAQLRRSAPLLLMVIGLGAAVASILMR